MKKIIKYVDLYEPIKAEIKRYMSSKSAREKNLDFETAMKQWFSKKFDIWMDLHAEKSDRRAARDRRAAPSSVSADRRKGSRRTADRRKTTRFNIELPVASSETVQAATKDGGKIEEFMGASDTMRGGGLYFKSNEPLAASSMIRMVLDFSGIDPHPGNIEASAMVVRSEKLRGGKYGVSLMFSRIDEKEKPDLNYMIFKTLAFKKSDLYTLFSA